MEHSPQTKTRQKKSINIQRVWLYPEIKTGHVYKRVIGLFEKKKQLREMHASGLSSPFTGSAKSMTVVFDNKIVSHEFEEEQGHEKADTLTPYQVLKADEKDAGREICVSSPDTNVFVLLLDLVSNRDLEEKLSLSL